MSKQKEQGFTIIELLISMSVFTVVLLVITGAVVQIGRLYSKGLTMSRTQEVARAVTDDLSRAIQYTPGTLKKNLTGPAGSKGVCVGDRRYSYMQNIEVEKNTATSHGLVSDNDATGCTAAQNLSLSTVSGGELLGDRMRVGYLRIQDITDDPTLLPSTVRISIKVIYGDDDLLCKASGTTPYGASCDNATVLTAADINDVNATDLRCKNIKSGTEFCAVSELSTIVERRL